jgi:hypothetical protein
MIMLSDYHFSEFMVIKRNFKKNKRTLLVNNMNCINCIYVLYLSNCTSRLLHHMHYMLIKMIQKKPNVKHMGK